MLTVRVHLNSIGHSVLGDNLYGNSSKRLQAVQDTAVRSRLKMIKRQALTFRAAYVSPSGHAGSNWNLQRFCQGHGSLKIFLNDYIRKKFKD